MCVSSSLVLLFLLWNITSELTQTDAVFPIAVAASIEEVEDDESKTLSFFSLLFDRTSGRMKKKKKKKNVRNGKKSWTREGERRRRASS